MEEQILYYDIETEAHGRKADPDRDILKYVGFRLPNGMKQIYPAGQTWQIQNILSTYPIIAGHNIKYYDNPIMERFGFKFNTHMRKRSVFVDTMEVINKRAKSMMGMDLSMEQTSLAYLCELFNLPFKKGSFDYNILKKPILTPEDYISLKEYLFADLDSGHALLEYLYEFFYGFKEFMSDSDKGNMSWLTCSSGTTAYKIICHRAGIPEIYNKNPIREHYDGGFVMEPQQAEISGNLVVFDFASAYPHAFAGGNLYSPVYGDEDGWSGENGIFGVGDDKITGKYSRKQGKIETVIMELYKTRSDIKKQMKLLDKKSDDYKVLNRKQLAIKIVINTIYGISGSPLFESVYNIITASDCTAMARTMIKHAISHLNKMGYQCIYTDTDSIFIDDPFNDLERLKRHARAISEIQRSSMNIPQKTHNFSFEAEISKMWFTLNDRGGFNKKRYMYLKKDGKLVLKGLKMVRGDVSELAKTVFEKYIVPELKKQSSIFFKVEYLISKLKEEGLNDTNLIAKRFRVGPITSYKNTTSPQAQISMRYGAGEHYLVPNHYVGAGVSKKLAPVSELKRHFKDEWIKAVNFKSYLKELNDFIRPEHRIK